MLPIYLFGNLHCIGMCGPLVMMIGQHRFRYFYFLGRFIAYGAAGFIAGSLGAVLNGFFQRYHLSFGISALFGVVMLLLGYFTLAGRRYVGYSWLGRRLAFANETIAMLMLKDRAWPTFLFGFFTIALPCGQTLMVFSACALSADGMIGLFNGSAFALLTSPSLLLAMQAHSLMQRAKKYYRQVVGYAAIFVGGIALLRASAEMGWIGHFVINPHWDSSYHLVIF